MLEIILRVWYTLHEIVHRKTRIRIGYEQSDKKIR